MTNIRTPKEVAIVIFFSITIALIILVVTINMVGNDSSKGNSSEEAYKEQATSVESQVGAYQNILKDNPQNLKVMIELGDVYFDNHRYQEALDLFLNAEKIDPDDVHIVNDLGLLHLNMTNYDNAILKFQRALEIDPTHIASLYYIALTHHYKGDNVKALQLFEEVKRSNPPSQFSQRVDQEITRIKELLSQQ